jgi:hypothetical protein
MATMSVFIWPCVALVVTLGALAGIVVLAHRNRP